MTFLKKSRPQKRSQSRSCMAGKLSDLGKTKETSLPEHFQNRAALRTEGPFLFPEGPSRGPSRAHHEDPWQLQRRTSSKLPCQNRKNLYQLKKKTRAAGFARTHCKIMTTLGKTPSKQQWNQLRHVLFQPRCELAYAYRGLGRQHVQVISTTSDLAASSFGHISFQHRNKTESKDMRPKTFAVLLSQSGRRPHSNLNNITA